MKKWILIGLGVLFISPMSIAQRKTKLNTNGQGTLFGQFGYNRSGYTATNVHVEGNNYNYTLTGVRLTDNEEENSMGKYFSDSSPQFSAKIGYFFTNKWAITASYDKYNTFFRNAQEVGLDGVFAPNSNAKYDGSIHEDIVLNKNEFNIAQGAGMHYISIGIQRNDMLGRTKRSEFAISTLYGLKGGIIFTNLDYTFNQYTHQQIGGVSGFGLTANLGIQMDFYQYIYLQLGLNGGLLNQHKLKLTSNAYVTGKQVVGYLSPSISLGFNIFVSPKNNCGTCPQW